MESTREMSSIGQDCDHFLPWSELQRMITPTRVTLANEYGFTLPVTAYDDDGELIDNVKALFSPALDSRLRAWAARFNDDYDYESGWPSLVECREAYMEGLELCDLVKEELSGTTVSYEFWETRVQGKGRSLDELR